MMTSIFLRAVLRSVRPDLGFNIREESIDLLLTLQDDAPSLIDFIEPLFRCLSKRTELRLTFMLLFFEQTQSLADDFAGVAVSPRGDLTRDKVVQMFGKIDVACRHDRLLSLPSYRDWQNLPIIFFKRHLIIPRQLSRAISGPYSDAALAC
jgi:hypothetical protein